MKSKYETLIVGLVALACFDGLAWLTISRFHAAAVLLRPMLPAVNIFAVIVIVGMHLMQNQEAPEAQAAAKRTGKRTKTQMVAWALYAWAGLGALRMAYLLHGIATRGWHWEIYELAGMVVGSAFLLFLVYIAFLLGR